MTLLYLMVVLFVVDSDTADLCGTLWEAVFSLFSALLQVSGQEALAQINTTCVKQWVTIAGITSHTHVYVSVPFNQV